ncbi:hypothetical protein E2562_039035 [Oryza meyeriana var. granulata]|uniref:Glabrous enhancer-binding protein-like DBD domain-containing protein n=1 Tax=Oryza meyeriana var. granulata TaxID=110450 RepID=A0A6G1EF62_9ORYZ|nr:hypothetical protein E2562_039035 [Oryza meyeriana var. granulata]
MAPTLPVPVPAHGHGKDKKKPLNPLEDRKRKKPSEVMSLERAKKKTTTPHEQQQQRATPTPSAMKQKPLPFQRTWTPTDEVRILEAMAAHRQEHGKVPTAAELLPVLDGRLDRKQLTYNKLANKLRTLMRRHDRDAKNGSPAEAHERRLYILSRNVWVGQTQAPNPGSNANSNIGGRQANEHDRVPSEGKTFDKLRDSYPNLTQAVMLLVDAEAQPADLETALTAIDDSRAQALDLKVSKLRKELTEAIMESSRPMADNKQQHGKSSAKGIICESSESGLQSIVADNQILCNISQTKMVVQQKLPCGKTKEPVEVREEAT